LSTWTLLRLSALIAAIFTILHVPLLRAAKNDPIQFEGQVLPHNVPLSKHRLTVALCGLGTPYNGRTSTDERGRFRFRELNPGTYSLEIDVPDGGMLLQTVELTESFADSKRTVRLDFELPGESRRSAPGSEALDFVSARRLSIPERSTEE